MAATGYSSVAVLILLFSVFLFLGKTVTATNANAFQFPAMHRIFSSSNTAGFSAENLEALSSATELATDANVETPHILCMSTADDGSTLYDKQRELSTLLGGIQLSLVVIRHSDKFACYSTVISRSDLHESGIQDDQRFAFRTIPLSLKIHNSLIQHISSDLAIPAMKKTDNGKKRDRQQVTIHFYADHAVNRGIPSRSLERSRINALHEALARATATKTPSQSLGEHGAFYELREEKVTGSSSSCEEMPNLGSAHYEISKSKNQIKIDMKYFRTLPTSCIIRFVEEIAALPTVAKIALSEKPRLLNFAARGITQTGTNYNEPYSAAGLRGLGQIVGVADTGLDDLSCFHYNWDDSVTTRELVTDDMTVDDVSNLALDVSRRKVIRYNYNPDSNQIDEFGGHGTHVCGSIVGNCLEAGFTMDDGMARDAQIAFFDIEGDDTEYLSIGDLTNMFDAAYSAGARIHSDSWGGSQTYYTEECQEFDQYLYDHPDFLIFVAAGNDGDSGPNSIGSPAQAKNTVNVGSVTTRVYTDDQLISESSMAFYSSFGPTDDGRYGIDIASPGDYIMSSMAGDPEELQAVIDGTSDATMMKRASTHMSGTSMATPVTAGNALLIRQFFLDSKFWASVCDSTTSASDPNPNFFCRAFSPSASLVKAVLLTSGNPVQRYSIEQMDAYTDTSSKYLVTPPDEFQGYGETRLSNVLPLSDGTGLDSRKKLFVYDSSSFTLAEGDVYKFTVTVNAYDVTSDLLDLKATIAWVDTPFQAESLGATTLVNDLDLFIKAPDGTYYMGNRAQSGDGDDLNNVEQVHITDIPSSAGDYEVYVRAGTLGTKFQAVSIAMTLPDKSTVTGPSSVTAPDFTSATFGPSATPPNPATGDLPLTTRSDAYSHKTIILEGNSDKETIETLEMKGVLKYISMTEVSILDSDGIDVTYTDPFDGNVNYYFPAIQLLGLFVTDGQGTRLQIGGGGGDPNPAFTSNNYNQNDLSFMISGYEIKMPSDATGVTREVSAAQLQTCYADGDWQSDPWTISLGLYSSFVASYFTFSARFDFYYDVSAPAEVDDGDDHIVPCDANSYGPNKGDCTPCPDMLVSNRGSNLVPADCYCPVGIQYDWTGSSSACTTGCEAGYFTNLGDCDQCKAGSYSEANAYYCTLCSAGTAATSDGSNSCTPCGAGFYQMNTPSQCQECSPGSYAAGLGNEECTLCPKGQYQDSNGQGSCVSCSSENYSTETEGSSSLTDCYCPSGYSLSNATCTQCLTGFYAVSSGVGDIADRDCQPCAASYTSADGAGACAPEALVTPNIAPFNVTQYNYVIYGTQTLSNPRKWGLCESRSDNPLNDDYKSEVRVVTYDDASGNMLFTWAKYVYSNASCAGNPIQVDFCDYVTDITMTNLCDVYSSKQINSDNGLVLNYYSTFDCSGDVVSYCDALLGGIGGAALNMQFKEGAIPPDADDNYYDGFPYYIDMTAEEFPVSFSPTEDQLIENTFQSPVCASGHEYNQVVLNLDGSCIPAVYDNEWSGDIRIDGCNDGSNVIISEYESYDGECSGEPTIYSIPLYQCSNLDDYTSKQYFCMLNSPNSPNSPAYGPEKIAPMHSKSLSLDKLFKRSSAFNLKNTEKKGKMVSMQFKSLNLDRLFKRSGEFNPKNTERKVKFSTFENKSSIKLLDSTDTGSYGTSTVCKTYTSHPTKQPTADPNPDDPDTPDDGDNTVGFTVSQLIGNIDFDACDASSFSASQCWLDFNTVVANILQIELTDVYYDSYAIAAPESLDHSKSLQSVDNLKINYYVLVWMGSGNEYDNVEDAYNTMVQLLEDAVIDGSMTAALRASGNPSYATAVADTIPIISDPTYSDWTIDWSDIISLSGGAIAGIVIGVLVFCGLLIYGGRRYRDEQTRKFNEFHANNSAQATPNPILEMERGHQERQEKVGGGGVQTLF